MDKLLYYVFIFVIIQSSLCKENTNKTNNSAKKKITLNSDNKSVTAALLDFNKTSITNESLETTIIMDESTTPMIDFTTEIDLNSTNTNITQNSENNTTNIDTNLKSDSNSGQPIDEEKHSKKKKKKRKKILVESKKDTCPCDLERYFCDINCCCDKDCSYQDKLVFQMCTEDKNRYFDTSFCRFSEYIYKNNTPYEWEVNQNGLFCIVKSNLPHQYVKQRKISIANLEEAQLQMTNKYFWTTSNNTISDPIDTKYYYFSYDSDIYFLRNNITEIFVLPAQLITDRCLITKEIKYLKSSKIECFQTNLLEDSKFINPQHYFNNLTVISNSNFTNSSTCFKNNSCMNISTKVCNEYEFCENITTLHSNISSACKLNLDNNYSCRNLVIGVIYNIYHNGTNGLKSLDLTLILSNRSFSANDNNVGFMQTFEVNFYWWNQTHNLTNLKSGNPGYIIGKPILISDIITIDYFNKTENNISQIAVNSSIDRQETFTNSFLVFPKTIKSKCVLNNTQYTPIKFGYNLISKCQNDKEFNISSIKLPKDICTLIQTDIFKQWSIRDFNISYSNGSNITLEKSVGYFGNSDTNNTNDWFKVLYEISPHLILNETNGNYTSDNRSIICENLYTKLFINIFHARELFKDLENQERIVNAMFSFEKNKYVFPMKNDKVFVNHNLQQAIMFFDITTEKIRKYVDPPSFDIKLPYDFFYPFVRIGSSAEKIRIDLRFTVLIVLFIPIYL